MVCQTNEEILKVAPAERLIASFKLDSAKALPEHFADFAELKVQIRAMCLRLTPPSRPPSEASRSHSTVLMALSPLVRSVQYRAQDLIPAADLLTVERWVAAARPKRVTVVSALNAVGDAVILDRAGADVQVRHR